MYYRNVGNRIQKSLEEPKVENKEKFGLSIEEINKYFGKVHALENVNLGIKEGEFFTLLGPSGCGKTTLLRIIAGLELPDTGRIILDGEDISHLPATKRQVNIVFQSYALFPHLSVFENVAFGLRSRKFPEDEIKKKVGDTLEMLGLQEMADRYPHQLSGGQQQRVALSRALVNAPKVLLLDEPMSALDAKLRAQVQVELRRLQRRLGRTFILVTHDQTEAMVVSDRIAVMSNGKVMQVGTPNEVYERPRTTFVAEFLGAANLIKGRRKGKGVETDYGVLETANTPPWEQGALAIRPERIRLSVEKPAKNGIRLRIVELIYRGTDLDIWLEPGPIRVRTQVIKDLEIGNEIWLELPVEALVILNG